MTCYHFCSLDHNCTNQFFKNACCTVINFLFCLFFSSLFPTVFDHRTKKQIPITKNNNKSPNKKIPQQTDQPHKNPSDNLKQNKGENIKINSKKTTQRQVGMETQLVTEFVSKTGASPNDALSCLKSWGWDLKKALIDYNGN